MSVYTYITGSEHLPFSASIAIPLAGTPVDAISVNEGFRSLADRTAWLSGAISFADEKAELFSKNRVIEACSAQLSSSIIDFAATGTSFSDFVDTENFYVAVGNRTVMSSSNAGRTWISSSLSEYPIGVFNGIASGSATNSIVIVGTVGSIYSIGAAGDSTITKRTASAGYSGIFVDVHWASSFATPRYVAVGFNTEIQTSENGADWTRRFTSTGPTLYKVIDHNGIGTAVGSVILRSTNSGAGWTQVLSGTNLRAIAFGRTMGVDRLVAVGLSGQIKWSIDGGLNWGDGIPPPDAAPGFHYTNITFYEGTFLAVTTSGTSAGAELHSSINGVQWKVVSKKVAMEPQVQTAKILSKHTPRLMVGGDSRRVWSSNIIPKMFTFPIPTEF